MYPRPGPAGVVAWQEVSTYGPCAAITSVEHHPALDQEPGVGAAAPWPRLWMAISSLQGGRWPVALAPRPRMADCDTSLWLVTTDEAVAVWRVAEALLIVAGAGHGV